VVRLEPFGFGREAERDSRIELGHRIHLTIEPGLGARPGRVGPAQARPQVTYAQPAQPPHGLIEPMVFEVEPLADAELGREVGETLERALGRKTYELEIAGEALRGWE